jgi:hypothetical protein
LIPKGAFEKKTERFQEFSGQILFFRVKKSYPADRLIETTLKRLVRDRWTRCDPAAVNWERYITSSSRETKQEDLGKEFHFIRRGEVLHLFFSYQLVDIDRVPSASSPLSASAKYVKLSSAIDAHAFLTAQEIKCENAKR